MKCHREPRSTVKMKQHAEDVVRTIVAVFMALAAIAGGAAALAEETQHDLPPDAMIEARAEQAPTILPPPSTGLPTSGITWLSGSLGIPCPTSRIWAMSNRVPTIGMNEAPRRPAIRTKRLRGALYAALNGIRTSTASKSKSRSKTGR